VIVLIAEEFPSNVLPWRRVAAERGAVLRTVPTPADSNWTKAILAAIDESVKVVSISTCHWTNGAAIDVQAIADVCHSAGMMLVVDATQGVEAQTLANVYLAIENNLEIIPVLEICGGRVIDPEATAPEADDLPLPPVASSSVPFEAVDMLVRSAPVRRICILDRDAMAGRPAQMYTLAALETRFPRVEFWVETGARDAIAVKNPQQAEAYAGTVRQAVARVTRRVANVGRQLELPVKPFFACSSEPASRRQNFKSPKSRRLSCVKSRISQCGSLALIST
jgi:hypothetical protein